MKINELIKAARIEQNITQKQLAEKINVRQATITEFETGKHALGSDKLEAIMNVFGLTISKLHDCQ
jgi:transcriptional regulator with XRE-family HTH domain